MLTFAVIGTGSWGTKVIKAIRALGYDVRVCNRHGEFEDQSVCRDYRKLIPEVDIVWVATHPSTNCEIAAYAIEHNKPTVVEKPVAFTSQQVAGLVRASKAKQVPLIVDYIHLFNTGLMETYRKGVTRFTARLGNKGPQRDYSAMWDYGSHAVAVALKFFDEDPVVSLQSQRTSSGAYEVTITFEGGTAHLFMSNNLDVREIAFTSEHADGNRCIFRDNEGRRPLQTLIGVIANMHMRGEVWTNGDLAVEVTDVLERLHKLLPQ